MKKLLLFIILFGVISCNKDEYLTVHEDMMFFAEIPSTPNGYISSVQQLDAKPNSQVELLVMRNAFAAKDHPRQTVKIVVVEKSSTAFVGTDFTVSDSELIFNGKNEISKPIIINIQNAKGKIIVLQLSYEYYRECPAEGRKADRLKIKIK